MKTRNIKCKACEFGMIKIEYALFLDHVKVKIYKCSNCSIQHSDFDSLFKAQILNVETLRE